LPACPVVKCCSPRQPLAAAPFRSQRSRQKGSEELAAAMSILQLTHRETFDEHLDALRKQCFPGPYRESSRDEFDQRSTHAIINIDGELSAAGRLTPGPNAVFESWTNGHAEIPTGPRVIDLGRCMVSANFRGLDLFRLICLQGFEIAVQRRFTYVVGAVIPGRRAADVLLALGFQPSGAPVKAVEPIKTVLLQPLVKELTGTEDWTAWKKAEVLGQLHKRGFRVQSGDEATVSPPRASDRRVGT
jgi:hypothetical protein